MSGMYAQDLTPAFGTRQSDNYFLWNSSKPNNGADASIGYDIDQAQIDIGGVTYGDYDEYKQPHLSGNETVIKRLPDVGPQKYQETSEGDEDKTYNLKNMLDLNQKATMDDMIVEGNGRVGDIDKVIPGEFLPNKDLTMVHDDKETSIKGILEGNAVNSIFFSDMNMKVLQNALRYGVYQKTGQVIGQQSPEELYIVMRSIMLQYANFQSTSEAIVEEIKRLNGKVLIYCIDNVSSNVAQQLKYLEELKTLPTPIDRPAYVEHPKNLTYDISNLLGA
jgi:hypothetical protein